MNFFLYLAFIKKYTETTLRAFLDRLKKVLSLNSDKAHHLRALGRLALRFRLAKGRCTKCSCAIPDFDLSHAIAGARLLCKRCRNEGSYKGRCPICNGGRLRVIEYRSYGFKEIQEMHEKCFRHLITDSVYQQQFSPSLLIEKRYLICASCGQSILRENVQCPRCKSIRSIYGV